MITPSISLTLVLNKKGPCLAKSCIKLYTSKIKALAIVIIKIQNSALGLFLFTIVFCVKKESPLGIRKLPFLKIMK